MRPDTQIKEELEASVDEAAGVVREQEMTVEEEKLAVEELERQLMAADLAVIEGEGQQREGERIKVEIAEKTGSLGS